MVLEAPYSGTSASNSGAPQLVISGQNAPSGYLEFTTKRPKGDSSVFV